VGFLRPLESLIGVFQGLVGILVSGLVIFFPMVRGGGTVRVRGQFVEFSNSLVRIVWHSVLILAAISEVSRVPHCAITDSSALRQFLSILIGK
jgi:hypothetical protein